MYKKSGLMLRSVVHCTVDHLLLVTPFSASDVVPCSGSDAGSVPFPRWILGWVNLLVF